ncbi:hypothetical protein Bca4012_036869 [Brassica carinata]
MLCLMINKLSGGITYEEREGCLKLLPPEELEHLDILESKESSSPVKKLVSETVSVHCGFFNENGGFRISDEDKKFMQSINLKVVIALGMSLLKILSTEIELHGRRCVNVGMVWLCV